MDQKEGMRILAGRGWLSTVPVDFQRALLSKSQWHRIEPAFRFRKAAKRLAN